MRTILYITIAICLSAFGGHAAGGIEPYEETRYGLATVAQIAYDPSDEIDGFVMLNGFALIDYDRLMPHPAPDELFLKLEWNIGVANIPSNPAEQELIASVNMLAFYYPEGFNFRHIRPYGEAGIGIIYSGFRVEGQGLHVNFNPQFGLGIEVDTGDGSAIVLAARFHHISNGGTYKDNRGVNSAGIMLGYIF